MMLSTIGWLAILPDLEARVCEWNSSPLLSMSTSRWQSSGWLLHMAPGCNANYQERGEMSCV
jgi:hypothetical protein